MNVWVVMCFVFLHALLVASHAADTGDLYMANSVIPNPVFNLVGRRIGGTRSLLKTRKTNVTATETAMTEAALSERAEATEEAPEKTTTPSAPNVVTATPYVVGTASPTSDPPKEKGNNDIYYSPQLIELFPVTVTTVNEETVSTTTTTTPPPPPPPPTRQDITTTKAPLGRRTNQESTQPAKKAPSQKNANMSIPRPKNTVSPSQAKRVYDNVMKAFNCVDPEMCNSPRALQRAFPHCKIITS